MMTIISGPTATRPPGQMHTPSEHECGITALDDVEPRMDGSPGLDTLGAMTFRQPRRLKREDHKGGIMADSES
jgi:hypothetical protein